MIYATLIFWFGLLNRFRGTSYPLRIRNIFWCWIGIPLLLIPLGCPWDIALTIGLGYLVWGIPGWMRWASLNHQTAAWGQGRLLEWDEKFIEAITPGFSTFFKLLIRGLVWLLPMMIALFVLRTHAEYMLVIVPVFPAAYGLGWLFGKVDQVTGQQDVSSVAEPIIGMAWGLAVALLLEAGPL